MATTTYFDKNVPLTDPGPPAALNIALTSYLGTHTVLLRVDQRNILLDQEATAEFFSAVKEMARYLDII